MIDQNSFTSSTPSVNSIVPEINRSTTDHGIAVLSGSFIEGLLVQLMSQALVEDNLKKSFLDRATSKNLQNLAYLMGLIPKTLYEDLGKISKIRNAFAHEVSVHSFEEPRISALIRDFHALRQVVEIPESFTITDGEVSRKINSIRDLPLAMQFHFAVACASTLLEQITRATSHTQVSGWTYPTGPLA